jgi:hypothetical protein
VRGIYFGSLLPPLRLIVLLTMFLSPAELLKYVLLYNGNALVKKLHL